MGDRRERTMSDWINGCNAAAHAAAPLGRCLIANQFMSSPSRTGALRFPFVDLLTED